ncbi:hypothetical protein [Shumkonia mesophila]|uniref:hypothetical protein n=1 Tax=Shumkonia mesophila TaxID=2838854 RepID=UPI002934EB9F|nr:hypothetical protein [Shumkonia mesophila]
MPMIGTRTDGREVAFYIPDEWWMRRGDVCLHADEQNLCFVTRGEPKYWPVPTYEWPPRDRPPERVTLSIADAEAIARAFNKHTFGVSEEEAHRIVSSSMRSQNQAYRRAVRC